MTVLCGIMESIGQRTKRLREAKGLSQSELARSLNVKPQAIQALEAGTIARPRYIVALAGRLGVSPEEMQTGVKPQIKPQPVQGVRIEGTAKAGAWLDISLVDDDEHERPVIAAPLDNRYPHARQYALDLDGDSMNLRYPEGTKVICADWADLGLELKPGMPLHVEKRDGHLVEITVKVFAERDGKRWLDPESNNPKHLPLEVNGNEGTEIIVCGLVVSFWKPETY